MRWAFFLPDLRGGGAERAALLLSRYWPVSDERPAIVVRRVEGAYERDVADLEVVELSIPSDGMQSTFSTPSRLSRALSARGIGGVVTFLALPAAVAAKLFRPQLRVVWSVQNPPEWSHTGVGGVMRRSFVHAAIRALDGAVLPARGLTGSPAVAAFQGPVHFVPNPVDPMLAVLRGSQRARDTPRVVAVGRLVDQKRFDVLVEAIRVVVANRAVTVAVYGEGPLRADLERRCQDLGLGDIVSFPGWEQDLVAIYGDADLLVSSSDYEGFGNTLVEALASGVPVVATDAPFGPRDILDGGRFGILVPPRQPDALAHAILAALPGGAEHERLTAAASKRGDDYLAPAVASRMHKALADVGTRAGRPRVSRRPQQPR